MGAMLGGAAAVMLERFSPNTNNMLNEPLTEGGTFTKRAAAAGGCYFASEKVKDPTLAGAAAAACGVFGGQVGIAMVPLSN